MPRSCAVENPASTGAKWKEVKAPLDIAGPNATLPSPLRRVRALSHSLTLFPRSCILPTTIRATASCSCTQVWYCPAHYKHWIPMAHRALETRVVLTHIAHNAKPVFGASPEERSAKAAAAKAAKPSTKARRLPRARKV